MRRMRRWCIWYLVFGIWFLRWCIWSDNMSDSCDQFLKHCFVTFCCFCIVCVLSIAVTNEDLGRRYQNTHHAHLHPNTNTKYCFPPPYTHVYNVFSTPGPPNRKGLVKGPFLDPFHKLILTSRTNVRRSSLHQMDQMMYLVSFGI